MTPDSTLIDAEQRYLGACLFDPKAYWSAGPVRPDDFVSLRHAQIFEAVQVVMLGEGEAPPILVAQCLPAEVRDELYAYMLELAEATPTGTTAVHYADFMRLNARVRRAYQHMRSGLAVDGALDDATATVQRALEAARLALETDGQYMDLAEMVRQAEMLADTGRNRSVCTTIPSLDHELGGLSGPKLYVLGARTSVGKSLLAGQIAINAAEHGDRSIGFVSLEMSGAQIMSRMKAYIGKTPRPEAQMYCDDHVFDLGDITSRIRQWHCRHGIDLAIVDYIQIIRAPQYRARYEEVGAVSRELKRVAMEIRVPVLALAQLSREHEKAGRRPSLADLREAGNIEQDADVVLLLHPLEDRRHVEIGVAKNRDGPAGLVVNLEFSPRRLGLAERLP